MTTLLRLASTAFLIYEVGQEAGIWTATAVTLIVLDLECERLLKWLDKRERA